MKKVMGLFLIACVTLFGCSQAGDKQETIKVGMVTDVAGIDDGSFSELAWKGVNKFAEEYNKQSGKTVEIQYVTPKDTALTELTSNIDNLIMARNKIIVVAGFAFEEAVGISATEHKDVDFILIDGEPLVDGKYVSLDNVVSVKFKENEAGFLAGVATALESKTGKVGYLGGIEVPAVVSYGVGFNYGVEYANEHLGTDVTVTDYIYSGTFTDFSLGQMLSAGMFDKGVDIIMATAGVATQGAISEAKQRGDVYIVGCDSNQYQDGMTDNGDSVVLTSAMKHIDVVVDNLLEEWSMDKFQGGKTISTGITSDSVGLPSNNPNLTTNNSNKLEDVKQLLKNGEIVVPFE